MEIVSVPLRGYGFEIYQRFRQWRGAHGVSVPLRGYGFEILLCFLLKGGRKTFPSPCGDMVLKWQYIHVNRLWARRFRPLAGIWFWNNQRIRGWHRSTRVSVPLRGYGFEISFNVCRETSVTVSVPLRGYGFEILFTAVWTRLTRSVFPSPCGDMVLKSMMQNMNDDLRMVSVPLRGYGFEIHCLKNLCHPWIWFPSPCGDMVLKS